MPFADLTIVPGIDTEKTLAQNEAGASSSSFIRWRNGIPEKRGGWSRYVNATFDGTIKALHAWRDLAGDQFIGVGTTEELAYIHSGSATDITARRLTANYAVSITTTSSSATVTVTATGTNATVYDSIVFNTPVSVGGLLLYGAYQVATSIGANSFTITAPAAATGSVTNGGAVASYATTSGSPLVTVTLNNHGYSNGDYYPALIATTVGGVTISGVYFISQASTNTFVINVSNSANATTSGSQNGGQMSLTHYATQGPPILGTGYGVGTYGGGKYGQGNPTSGPSLSRVTATDYWLDNWGTQLISCPAGGPLFTWSQESGYINSQLIPQAPLANAGMMLAMPQQQIMCWGSTYNGVSDPRQIRWSDAGDYTTWLPQALNQAGGYYIPTGNQIQRIIQVSQQVMVLTDVDCYTAQYVGGGTIWSFNRIASGCGLIAPKAIAVQNTAVYWMSQKQFYASTGSGVQTLPCTVWDAVFQNLNEAHVNNIVCGSNSQFNEIVWFYPSYASNSGANDSYVSYNTAMNEWDFGSIDRTAWMDQSIIGSPLGASSGGYVYQHEVSPDGDGQAINASLSTGYFSLSNGEEFVFIDWVQPDFKWNLYSNADTDASVQMTFYAVNYLGDVPRQHGPYVFNKRTPFLPVRIRARYVRILIESTDLGSWWRLGKIRYRFSPDGRR